jgi:galactitol-specific phosphotransferase system IIC component
MNSETLHNISMIAETARDFAEKKKSDQTLWIGMKAKLSP